MIVNGLAKRSRRRQRSACTRPFDFAQGEQAGVCFRFRFCPHPNPNPFGLSEVEALL